MDDDSQLLRRFVEDGSDEAFKTIVHRHVDMVYSAALRQCRGDCAIADEVAQLVFVSLARKARVLVHRTDLAGWLYLSVGFAAASKRRSERRWRRREKEANMIREQIIASSVHDEEWSQIRPVIDGAMHELSDADRDAILLRFFQGQPFSAIAARLRVNEDAARKRVERGLEKLQVLLTRRGITSTVSALAIVLGAKAMTPAPASVVTAATTASLKAGAATGATLALMSTSKIAISVVTLAVIGSFVTWRVFRDTVVEPHQTAVVQPPLTDSRPAHEQPLSELNDSGQRAAEDLTDLKKRWEAAVAAADARKRMRQDTPAGMRPISEVQHTDKSTPAAASDVVLWAATSGDLELLSTVVAMDPATIEQAKTLFFSLPEPTRLAYGSPEKLALSLFAYGLPPVTAVGDVTTKEIYDGLVQTQARVIPSEGVTKFLMLQFEHGADGWRVPPRRYPKRIISHGTTTRRGVDGQTIGSQVSGEGGDGRRIREQRNHLWGTTIRAVESLARCQRTGKIVTLDLKNLSQGKNYRARRMRLKNVHALL